MRLTRDRHAGARPVTADPPLATAYRLPALDGVRGVALIIVLAVHTDLAPFKGVPIEVFFVLSGLVITGLLLREHRAHGRIAVRRFYLGRAVRLFPVLAVATLIVTGSTLLAGGDLGRQNAAATLPILTYCWNLVQAFDPHRLVGNYAHLWTLSVEEQFYLAWPLLLGVLMLVRRSTRAVIAVCAAGFVLASVYRVLRWDPAAVNGVYMSSVGRWDSFLTGCGLAVLFAHGNPDTVHRYLVRPSRWLGGLGVAWILALVFVNPKWNSATLAFVFVVAPGVTTLATGAALVRVLTAPAGLLARWLSLRPMRYLGRISYSLYVWHLPVFDFLLLSFAWPRRLVLAPVQVVVALAVGHLSFRVIEQPCMQWLRRRRTAAGHRPVAVADTLPAPPAATAAPEPAALAAQRRGPA